MTRKNAGTCLRNSCYLDDNDQDEEKKEESRFRWLLKENNLKTKDILKIIIPQKKGIIWFLLYKV